MATVVALEGRLLLVEERIDGQLVLNQPAGHLEPGESLVEAAVREIWSPAYRADAGAFPGPVANRLLEASHALKLGAWVNNAGFAVLVVKVDAGIDAEALDQAIGAAVTSADEMERELAGDPDSDEF